MFCPFCGQQVNDNSSFCMNCGNHLNNNQAVSSENSVSQPDYQSDYVPQSEPDFQTPAPVAQPVYTNPPIQQPVYNAPQTPPVQQPMYAAPPVQQPVYTPPSPPVQQPMYAAPPTPQPMYAAPSMPQMSMPVKANPFGWLKIVAILVVVAGIIFAALHFLLPSDEELIRDRIETFSEACNDGDIEVMIGCFDKKTQKLYDASMGITEGLMGGLIGFDLPWGDMMELGGFQLGGMVDIDIEIKSIKINDDKAQVEVVMTAEGESMNEVLPMCEEDGDWYIDISSVMSDVIKEELDGQNPIADYFGNN